MRVLRILSVAAALFAGAHTANAVPVGAGPTINLYAEVQTKSSDAKFSSFQVGERVQIRFAIPGTVYTGAAFGNFTSATGSAQFIGMTSGANFTTAIGTQAHLRGGIGTRLRSTPGTSGVILTGLGGSLSGIEILGTEWVSTSDINTYLSYFTNGQTSAQGFAVYEDGIEEMTFGAATVGVIPLPAGGFLLLGGLGALALRRKLTSA